MASRKLSSMKLGSLKLSNSGGTGGTAQAAQVLAPTTFTNDDGEQTGTMVDRAGDTAALSSTVSGTILKLLAPAGFRDGVDDNVTLTDAAFIAANILATKTVHGLAGTATADANAIAADILLNKTAYVNGVKLTGTSTSKKFATGVVTSPASTTAFKDYANANANYYAITVSGLAFTPSVIEIILTNVVGAGAPDFTIYDAAKLSDVFATGLEKIVMTRISGGTVSGTIFRLDGTVAFVNTGFNLPVGTASTSYTWKAWE